MAQELVQPQNLTVTLQSATWNVLGQQDGKRGDSTLWGQGKLELPSAGKDRSGFLCQQPKRNLLSAFMWILVAFPLTFTA